MQAITPNQNLTAKGAQHCMENPNDYDGPRFMEGTYQMASQVLADHFDPSDDEVCDCTRQKPCEVAARYLLATGRIEGVRGYIYNGRPTNYIADPAPGGEGAPVGPTGRSLATQEAPAPSSGSGKGPGSGGGRSKSGPKAITEPQKDMLGRLMTEHDELVGAPEEVTKKGLESIEHIDAKQASGLIDMYLNAIKGERAKARKAKSEQAQQSLVEGGMYRHGEDVYWIKRSKSSQRLYAMRVVLDEDQADLEYAAGVVNRLDPDQKLDTDQAREIASAYGKATGKCMVCGRKLTNAESIEQGIGPICGENL